MLSLGPLLENGFQGWFPHAGWCRRRCKGFGNFVVWMFWLQEELTLVLRRLALHRLLFCSLSLSRWLRLLAVVVAADGSLALVALVCIERWRRLVLSGCALTSYSASFIQSHLSHVPLCRDVRVVGSKLVRCLVDEDQALPRRQLARRRH